MIKILNKAYQVGNVAYTDIADAQKAELQELVNADPIQGTRTLADWIVTHKDKVMDILTTNANSRPSARKANGGRKTRTTTPVPAVSAPVAEVTDGPDSAL